MTILVTIGDIEACLAISIIDYVVHSYCGYVGYMMLNTFHISHPISSSNTHEHETKQCFHIF
jgi:hypothetical protein